MKRSLLPLAVLGAFAGAASAQTSITIYGSFDGGIRNQTNATPAGSRLSVGSNGTYNSNRLGFKGVEDLGGGLNAHFQLETGFNTGTGTLDNTNNRLFNRTASVGLGGAWGALDLGRQYSVNYLTIALYDPFQYKYTGIIPLATQGGINRLDNDIKYTGKFAGIGVSAEYAPGEVAGSTGNNATEAIGLNYTGGPFVVGAAYTTGKRAGSALAGAPLDQTMKNWTIGGTYATGPFRVALGYADFKQDLTAGGQQRTKDWWLGGSYQLTPAAALSVGYYQTKGISGTNTVALTNDDKRKLFIVGATYALSKRTNFYADIDNARYNNAANSPNQTGVSIGINHLF
jgi:predicted porin